MRLYRQGMRTGVQRGFSLVELLIAMTISGILIAGLTTGIVQVMVSNAGSIAHMTAVKEVENAVHWLSRDAEMAQTINGNNVSSFNITPVPFSSANLSMSWNNEFPYNSNNISSVTYSVAGGALQRSFTTQGEPPSITIIVPHLGASNWGFSGNFSFNITANISGFRPASETRTITVLPRIIR